MNHGNTLVALAAGMGSRYGGLKQIDPVGPTGETILDYSVHDAANAGFGKVVFVIRAEFEDAFRDKIGSRYRGMVAVDYVHQRLDDVPPGFVVPAGRVKPWGTAHAILSARAKTDTPFAVINADDFYGADSFRVLSARLARPDFASAGAADTSATYAMVGFPLRNTLSRHGSVCRGVCRVDTAGRLAGIEEITAISQAPSGAIKGTDSSGAPRRLSADDVVSMNMWGFPLSLFSRLDEAFQAFLARSGCDVRAEFFIPTVVEDLLRTGRAVVDILPTSSAWFGVTYREDRPAASAEMARLVDEGVYPRRLFG